MSISVSSSTFARVLGSWRGNSRGPAYRQLADAIRRAILDGRVVIGTRIPAERDAAQALGVSRTTIASAYASLRDEGWLASRQGSGSIVRMARTTAARSPMFPGGTYADDGDVIDLTTAALPAPQPAFNAALDAAMPQFDAWTRGPGYHALGLPQLRARVAEYYSASGLPTSPDQILITNGAQHGLSLCLAELTSALDRIIIESPTYPAALDVVRRTQRTTVGIGVLPDGDDPWPADLVDSSFRQTAASAAYLIPDFHNPTGRLMGERTREQIMTLARRHGTTVIVDESFRDLTIDPVEMPARMAKFDTDGRCITLGSLSKPVWGGLRIGWLRASSSVVERIALARALSDMAGPVLEQLIAVEVLERYDDCLAIQSEHVRAARDAATAALAEHAPDWRWHTASGGVTLWLRLPHAVAGEASRIAPEYGVRLAPGTRFGPDGAMDNYLRIPLTRPPDVMADGIRRVVATVAAAVHTPARTQPEQPLPMA